MARRRTPLSKRATTSTDGLMDTQLSPGHSSPTRNRGRGGTRGKKTSVLRGLDIPHAVSVGNSKRETRSATSKHNVPTQGPFLEPSDVQQTTAVPPGLDLLHLERLSAPVDTATSRDVQHEVEETPPEEEDYQPKETRRASKLAKLQEALIEKEEKQAVINAIVKSWSPLVVAKPKEASTCYCNPNLPPCEAALTAGYYFTHSCSTSDEPPTQRISPQPVECGRMWDVAEEYAEFSYLMIGTKYWNVDRKPPLVYHPNDKPMPSERETMVAEEGLDLPEPCEEDVQRVFNDYIDVDQCET